MTLTLNGGNFTVGTLALGDGLKVRLQELLIQFYHFAVAVGGPGLFLLALADSSFLSIPEGNDVLIVILSTGQSWSTMSYYAGMTTLGSICGCSLLYLVGRRGGPFIENRLKKRRLGEIETLFRRWGVLAVLVPSLLPPPTPFKVFVLSAGAFKVPMVRFLVAVSVGRSIRYFSWGILAVWYGEWAKELMEAHVRTVGIVLFVVFLSLIAIYLFFQFRTGSKTAQEGG